MTPSTMDLDHLKLSRERTHNQNHFIGVKVLIFISKFQTIDWLVNFRQVFKLAHIVSMIEISLRFKTGHAVFPFITQKTSLNGKKKILKTKYNPKIKMGVCDLV